MGWHTKNTYGYIRTSTEAYDNAKMIYDILAYCGWQLPAVCACLGNCEVESGYNAWRWQNEVLLPVGDPRIYYQNSHAYGLFQQDPASKYIDDTYAQSILGYGPNYADQVGNTDDGTAQCFYLHNVCSDPNAGEWSNPWQSTYYMPFGDFISDSTHTIEYLVHTFLVSYERGLWSDTRVTAANYWYNVFQNVTPTPPPDPPPQPPPVPITGRSLPVWLFIKILQDKQHGKYRKQNGLYKKW